MKLQRMAVICILGALVLLTVFYYAIDPARNVWVPKCAFHTLTGFSCPACGSQRALHALLHGRWQEALAFNWFLIVSILSTVDALYQIGTEQSRFTVAIDCAASSCRAELCDCRRRLVDRA